jgi:hypothetical protein
MLTASFIVIEPDHHQHRRPTPIDNHDDRVLLADPLNLGKDDRPHDPPVYANTNYTQYL